MRRLTREEQIQRMTTKHQGFYTYENWGWPKSSEKSIVTCPEHGDFTMKYTSHANDGQGCPSCAKNCRREAHRSLWQDQNHRKDMSDHMKRRWAEDRDYRRKMTLLAKERANDPEWKERQRQKFMDPEYQQYLHSQRTNDSFPEGPSLGIQYIAQFLKYHHIEYQGGDDLKSEFIIPNSNGKRFDFYLPDYSLFIEFHGSQHYKGWKGKESNLEKKQDNDQWKEAWVDRQPGLNLLVIPYWDIENIEPILSEALGL